MGRTTRFRGKGTRSPTRDGRHSIAGKCPRSDAESLRHRSSVEQCPRSDSVDSVIVIDDAPGSPRVGTCPHGIASGKFTSSDQDGLSQDYVPCFCKLCRDPAANAGDRNRHHHKCDTSICEHCRCECKECTNSIQKVRASDNRKKRDVVPVLNTVDICYNWIKQTFIYIDTLQKYGQDVANQHGNVSDVLEKDEFNKLQTVLKQWWRPKVLGKRFSKDEVAQIKEVMDFQYPESFCLLSAKAETDGSRYQAPVPVQPIATDLSWVSNTHLQQHAAQVMYELNARQLKTTDVFAEGIPAPLMYPSSEYNSIRTSESSIDNFVVVQQQSMTSSSARGTNEGLFDFTDKGDLSETDLWILDGNISTLLENLDQAACRSSRG